MNRRFGVDDTRMYGDAFVGPAPERVGRDTSRSLAIALFAALLAFAGGAVAVASNATQSWFPTSWDPRVAPIAAEVARLRGLDFIHPVPIHYLAPKDFERQLGSAGPVSAAERTEVTREEAVFRSLGYIGGNVDLLRGLETSQASGTLAYYSFAQKAIFVRGTTLDAEHRVTIAHELTHVLQDQHFDLESLERRAAASSTGDVQSLKALIEGDAVRIEQDYLKQQPKADQQEYKREYKAEGARVGKEMSAVPQIVDVLMGAPYEFGPATIRVLLESGGNTAVDDALTGPAPWSGVFVKTGDVSPAIDVTRPLPSPDGVLLGQPALFGPFETYLTLATRLDPERALEAADAVDGGEAITFESRGTICYRVSVDARSEQSRPFLLAAIQSWASGRSRTSVDPAGDLIGFTVCDPGRTAPAPSLERFHAALDLLSIRTELTVGAAKGHRDGGFARCAARSLIEAPGAQQLIVDIGNSTPTAAQRSQLQPMLSASRDACRADPESGLR